MRTVALPILLGVLAGCGGGGGGGGGGAAPVSANLPPPAAVANQSASPAQNVLPISVNRGPANTVNLAFASVTVCVPGSSVDCRTIDGIMVDTGSVGLRILASALAPVSLPQQTDASGNPVVECAQFAYGFTWGPVKTADIGLGGEQASSLPIQVIGDPSYSSVPSACSSTGPSRNSVQTLAANGILGVGSFLHDCGNPCAQSSSPGLYYVCPASGCRPDVRPLAGQVPNPVSKIAGDNNNGIMVQLPSVPDSGSSNVEGSLVFGIGTRANNALGSAAVFTLSTLTGDMTTYYKGNILAHSFIDSGSNALFFKDISIPTCTSVLSAGFYCAPAPQALSATIQGLNGTNASIDFNVANADTLLGNGSSAYSNLASPLFAPLGFDWGLPFFYGRRVFVALEGTSVPGAPAGPFIAF